MNSCFPEFENGVKIFNKLYTSIYPITFLILGFFGNVLIIIVMSKRIFKNRHLPTKDPINLLYLVLAIGDFLAFPGQTIQIWIQSVWGINIYDLSVFSCRVLKKSLSYIIGDFSLWMVVFISFDRFLRVWWPTKFRDLINSKKVLIVLTILFVLALLKNVQFYYQTNLFFDPLTNTTKCLDDPNSPIYEFYRNHYDYMMSLIFVSGTPSILVLILNILMLIKLKIRRSLSAGKLNNSVRVVMVISVAFLLTLTPFFIIINVGSEFNWYCGKSVYSLLVTITLANFYMNHVINFIFYLVMSKNFRKDSLEIFKFNFRKLRGNNSVSTTD
uniref:GCR067 n=1 Tax=Schmidtea mediterranea TaxID=79327 RepID=A0A193KUA1_SCHMD|nr:GCR067 [Schmidtea mediterranea]